MIKIGKVIDITRSEDGIWAVIETEGDAYVYAEVPPDTLNGFMLDEFLHRLQQGGVE